MSQLRLSSDIRGKTRVDRLLRSLYGWACMRANGDDLGNGGEETDGAVVFYNDLPLKTMLKEKRSAIVDDLQEDVIEEMRNCVLNKEEYEDIIKQSKLEDKIEKLLDILDTKSSPDVALFVNSLKEWYKWIYDMFNPLPQEVTMSVTKSPPRRVSSLHEKLEQRLTIGGVPPAPRYNITRSKLVQKVRQGLMEMKGNSFLVLCGMPGIGKSTLAAEALRDPTIVMDEFEGNVIWLTVGGTETAGRESDQKASIDIMALLHNLNYRLGDERIEEGLSPFPEFALVQLKKRYLDEKSSKKKCLIVLDEVQDPKVIEQLNVGVRFLVTTSDLNVISDALKSVTKTIKVDDAFTEEETLELFAKGLKVSKSEIQKEAKLIHRQFRGFPRDISLITSDLAEHREEAVVKKEHWNHYLSLSKNQPNKRCSLQNDQAIEHVVNSLEPELKKYFKYFALFMDEVNLKPEVLSVVWGLDKKTVQSIMMQFMNKSLVQRAWQLEHKSYVYGVHTLNLRYIKSLMTSEELEGLHRSLVHNYMEKANGEPSQLDKDDNYILHFIGYHLENARLFDMFPRFYYDLAFLEAKIKLTDPYDVLRDLNKYKKYIVKVRDKSEEREGNPIFGPPLALESDSKDKFSSLYEFVENCTHWVVKGIDIAQLAVQESESRPFIYKKGVELVNKRFQAGQAFIRFPLGSVRAECTRRVVKLKKEKKISAVDFANSTDNILIGLDSGEIAYHDLHKNRTLAKCVGHDKAVKHLRISQDSEFFVSASVDGRVLKWSLTDLHRRNSSPPPSEIQQNYESMWASPEFALDLEPTEELARFNNPCKWVCLHKTNEYQFMAVITERSYTDRTVVHVFRNGSLLYRREIDGLKFCEFFHGLDGKLAVAGNEGVFISTESSCERIVMYPVVGLHIWPNYLVIVGKSIVDALASPDLQVNSQRNILQASPDVNTCSDYSSYLVYGTQTNSVVVLNKDGEEIHRYGGEQKATLLHVKTWSNAVLAVYENNTIDTYVVTENSSSVPCAVDWPLTSPQPLSVRCDRANRVAAYRGKEVIFHWDHIQAVDTVSGLSSGLSFAFCDRKLFTYLVKLKAGRTRKTQIYFSLQEPPCRLLCHSVGREAKHVVVACPKSAPVVVWHEGNNSVKCKTGKDEVQELTGTDSCLAAGFNLSGNLFVVTKNSVQRWGLNEGSFELQAIIYRSMRKATLLASKEYVVHFESRQTHLFIVMESALISKAQISIEGAEDCYFSPDGNSLALLGQGILVYNVEQKKSKSYAWPNGARWRSAAVSNAGHVCVVMTDGQILIYSPDSPSSLDVRNGGVGGGGGGIGRACLAGTHVAASPSVPDSFVVTDRTGEIHFIELLRGPIENN